jgi:heme-degrading monooxygenase HmoA
LRIESPSQKSATLINIFEVEPALDHEFVAWWTRTRDFLNARVEPIPTALHRALSPAATFRFVNIAQIARPELWGEAVKHPDFPGGDMPGRRYPSLYDVIVADGTGDPDKTGVIVINPFEVPVGESDAFLAQWHRARKLIRHQPGRLGMRLHQSRDQHTRFPFVLVAEWEDAAAFERGHQHQAVRDATTAISYPGHPAVYEVISH